MIDPALPALTMGQIAPMRTFWALMVLEIDRAAHFLGLKENEDGEWVVAPPSAWTP